MVKNKAANGEWQLFSESESQSYQLDLLSFVTDHSPVTFRQPEKKLRSNSTKINTDKIVGFHHYGIVDKNKNFSNFKIGDSNQNAYEKIAKFISNEYTETNILVINGKSGLGKSHLLHSVANEFLKNRRSFYLSSAFLIPSMAESFSIFNNYSFLLIDDFHEIDNNKELQKVFCQLLDQAHLKKLKIIITSSKDINLIDGIEERIVSKLTAATIESIDYFDGHVADEFINSKLIEFNFNIDEFNRSKIKKACKPNGYLLEGILLQLKEGKTAEFNTNCQKDLNQFQTSLLDFEKEGIELIIKNVALDFNVTKEDLYNCKKDKNAILARHVSMYILKEKVGLSLNQIGKLFQRDHTTVIYAVDKIKKQIQKNLDFKQRLLKLVF